MAEEMSFSSLAWPCTEALAASHRLLVAAATIRAWRGKKNRTLRHFVGKCSVKLCKYGPSHHTYSRDETLGPLSIIYSVGRDEAHFALSHQLSLGSRGRFDQSAGGCSDGLGRLQDLLLKVQRLICLLKEKEIDQSDGLTSYTRVMVATFITSKFLMEFILNGTLSGMEKVTSG